MPNKWKEQAAVDPIRAAVFAESLHRDDPPALRELEREALEAGVPIIRPQTRSLIHFLLEIRRPLQILEIGTAVGYSALYMHSFAPPGCRITTIEIDAGRAALARENFVRSGADDISLLQGDAAQILPSLEGPYDLILMDASKGQYIHFLPEVLRLLSPGGIIVSDNCLQDGEILESRYIVRRRDRTIHRRMREYLEALYASPSLVTVLLEAGDGIALSVRKSEKSL